MSAPRDEFLSEEDLDLRNLTPDELDAYWTAWLVQAQATNESDEDTYSHGVFAIDGPLPWASRRAVDASTGSPASAPPTGPQGDPRTSEGSSCRASRPSSS